MTTSHLIDRMPEVARLESEWTPVEVAHLEGCEECRSEWRVVTLSLEGRAPLPELDADRIAAAVLGRLTYGPGRSVPSGNGSRRWLRPLIGLAAAAAVVLTATLVRSRVDEPVVATTPVREATMLPELDELLQGEMEVLLASMETDRAAQEPIGSLPRLGDLTDTELEQLLREVEG